MKTALKSKKVCLECYRLELARSCKLLFKNYVSQLQVRNSKREIEREREREREWEKERKKERY